MRFLPGCSVKEAVRLLCADAICVALLATCMFWGGNPVHLTPSPLPRHFACTSSLEELTSCAAGWVESQPRVSSNSDKTHWQAAEFRGVVDGVSHRMIVGKDWCPGAIGSDDEIESIVADYLMAHRGLEPPVGNATTMVVVALSTKAPCESSQ